MGQSGTPGGVEGAGEAALTRLPPGQREQHAWPVLHYGPVPRFKPDRWDMQVYGATADGGKQVWDYEAFGELPCHTVATDFHCVTKFSILGCEWTGVLASTVLELAPPAADAVYALVWAEYGYSASLRVEDLRHEGAIFATHRDGVQLTAEHGFPLRLIVPHLYAWKGPKWVRAVEYLTEEKRGFWEERGYHNIGDPWQEQRYSYQED